MALKRVAIRPERPTGPFEVEYIETRRAGRRVIDRFPEEGFVQAGEAARIVGRSARTIYNWMEAGLLGFKVRKSGYHIPLSEIRRILREDADAEGGGDEEEDS